jgi:ABC-type transporter Mla subunit MlaD
MFMARESAGSGQQGQRIDIEREQDLREWARKLDATEEQLRQAVQAVGPLASDVEDHLKGSRATTNSERTHQALKQDGAS